MKKFSIKRVLILSLIVIVLLIRFPLRQLNPLAVSKDCMPTGGLTQEDVKETNRKTFQKSPVRYVLFGSRCTTY